MTEDNRNTITYDDDWKSVSYSEYPKTSEEYESEEIADTKNSSNNQKSNKKDPPVQLVITVQLVCCILVALAAFLLNLFGGEVYAATKEWYFSNLEKSVIFDAGDNKIDLSNLFTATSDEVSFAEH